MAFTLLPISRLMNPLHQVGIPRALSPSQLSARSNLINAIEANEIRLHDKHECLCGSNELIQIARKDGFGLDFGAFLCRGCGLVITSPVISEDSMPEFYSKYYHDLQYPEPYSQFQGSLGRGHEIFHFVKDVLPKKNTISLLDVGAGTGNVLKEFRSSANDYGMQVVATALDYNPKIVEVGKQEAFNVIIGGLEQLAEVEEKYDIIILSHILEHINDIPQALKHLRQHMSADSIAYVAVPGLFSLKFTYGSDFLQYFVAPHLYQFNMLSLAHTMSREGFVPILGNELIQAVFKLGSQFFDVTRNAEAVLEYLEDLERDLTLCQLVQSTEYRIAELYASMEKIRASLPVRIYLFCKDRLNFLGGKRTP